MKSFMMPERVLLLFVLLAYLSFSDAITRYVDGVSGTADGSNGYFKTIQTALTSNLNGVTELEVVVSPTTTYSVDWLVEPSSFAQNITLRSSSTSIVTISCAVSNSGFKFASRSIVTLSYLKMINCISASPTVPLQFITVTTLTIQNCAFDKFNVGGVGGAVTIKDVASATLQSTTVTNSVSSTHGGAIYIENSFVQMFNSNLNTNTALDKGGAIYIGSSSSWGRTVFGLNLANNNIQFNSASKGGAVAVLGDSTSQITVNISGVVFRNNQAIYGGALYAVDAAVSVSTGDFTNNSVPCSTGGMNGGAVYIASVANSITSGYFDKPTFTSNSACKYGGGIYYDVSAYGVTSSPTFKNLKFSANSAQYTAGVYTNAATAVYNTCNFTSNTGAEVIRAVISSVTAQTLYIFNNNAAGINCVQSAFTFYNPHIWGNQPTDFPCPSDCSFVVASPTQLASKFSACDNCTRDSCTFCAGDSASPCTASTSTTSTTSTTTGTSGTATTGTTGTSGTSTSTTGTTGTNSTTGNGTTAATTGTSAAGTTGTTGTTGAANTTSSQATTGGATTGSPSTTDGSQATTSSDTPSSDNKSQKSSNIGLIAGAAAGGGVLLSVIAVLIVLLVRRKKQSNDSAIINLSSLNLEQSPSNSDAHYQRWSNNSGQRNSFEDTSYQSIGSSASVGTRLSLSSITKDQDTPYSAFSAFTFPHIEGATVIPYQDLDCQKELGRGSFGIVFKAVYDGRTVAVKQILGELNERQVNAIADEARIMVSVPPHPNVISMIGVVSYPPCIVLKFYHHGSLLSYLLDPKKKLSKQDTYKIIYGITAGMAHLAKYKIVHRDLAARNILVDEGMNAIVSDFGFARALQEDEHSGKTYTSIGPIKWMALEALTQRIYSEKSDVWSWAVTVWECLTRQPPWPGSDNVNTILAVSTGKRLPIPEVCSPQFGQLMQSCWKVDPEARPTFQELLEEVTKMGEFIFA